MRPSRLIPKNLFIVSLAAVVVFNIVTLTKELINIHKLKAFAASQFPGRIFSGLDKTLEGIKYAGYFTDKDINNIAQAKHFAQAQYVLAPVILDLNNTDHEYILFDCTSLKITFDKIKEIGAVPLKANQFGIILARKITAEQKGTIPTNGPATGSTRQ